MTITSLLKEGKRILGNDKNEGEGGDVHDCFIYFGF